MRRSFFFTIYATLLTAVAALGQTTTPNIGLKIPNYAQPSWHIPVDYNWNRLDGALSGQFAVPSILLSGPITNDQQAATKAYVDAAVASGTGGSGSTVYPGVGIAVSTGNGWTTSLTAPGGTIVGTTDVQALTNKTVNGTAPAEFEFLDFTSSGQTQINTKAPTDSPAFTGTPTAPTAASGTSTNQVSTTAFVQNLVSTTVNAYLPLTGGTLGGTLTLNDGSPAASQAFVASAIGSGGTGTGTGTGTTNQLLASKVISASAPGKICAAVAGINGSVQCSGVQGTPLSITVQTGLNSPILNTVGATNSVAQYGLNVNSSTNTQILMPTTVGSFDQATVFKREMWFTGGSNLSGVDNFETDTYNFDKTDQWEFMLGWQCRRNSASPNTGSDFWQYDNFKNGWQNSSVPCSIVAGHVYHYILMMHRGAVSSTACSGTGSDASVTAGPCEYWDTFQLDDLTAGTSNTYTLNAKLVAEPASLGGWQTWDGVGAQVQLDVIDSSTGGASTLVSMFTDNDTISAYTVVAGGGGGSSVTETTGNLGEYDFDGSSPTSGLTATGSPSLDNTNSYSSPNAALFNAASEYYSGTLSAAASSVYFRAMINLQTIPSGQTTQIVSLNNSSGGQLFNLYLASGSGFISAFDVASNSGLTCQAAVLSAGWHRLEFAWIEGSTGSYSVSIDGTKTCGAPSVNTGTVQAAKFQFGELTTPTTPFVFDMDNVGFSNTGPLGAVTISTSTTPLYDSYGSAAAVKASSLQASNNLSDLASDGAALSNLLNNPPAGAYEVSCSSSSSCSAIGASETVAFSATPTFSTNTLSSYMVLTGNVTSFTLAAGVDGQGKTLVLCQDTTGSRTVAAPANVRGLTVGATASKCSSQHFRYSVALTAWLADAAAATNE